MRWSTKAARMPARRVTQLPGAGSGGALVASGLPLVPGVDWWIWTAGGATGWARLARD